MHFTITRHGSLSGTALLDTVKTWTLATVAKYFGYELLY